MKNIATFLRGGVDATAFRSLTAHLPIANAPIPAVAVIPLLQHDGAEAAAVVAPGDHVKEGMLIARADGYRSAHVHSSIPGVVRGISSTVLPDGRRCRAVTIECAGEFDRSGKILRGQSWEDLEAGALNALIAEMGVVELGGKGVPAHLPYATAAERTADTLIVNGAECEPYLSGEHRLMLEKPVEILEGARILRKITGARNVVIAVAEHMPDAIDVFREKIAEKNLPFQLVVVKTKYPQGDERLLRTALMKGRRRTHSVPPADAFVADVGTIFAVYEAVVWRKPLIERVVTVSGSAVARPSNLKVRIGTSIRELFEDCGGFSEPPERIVMGGPFSGASVVDLDTPITKLTTGLLAMHRREAARYDDRPCIRCGRCLRVCPFALAPVSLVTLIKAGRLQEAFAEGLMECIECGCCAYVCPARIPLVFYIKHGKSGLTAPSGGEAS